jgi:Ca-activated chloride channel family protein
LQFNSWASKLFEKSVPVNPAELSEAEKYISSLEADGGTNMKSALKAALALPEVSGLMRQVVFITDGAVGNETELLQLVAGQLGQGRMFTVAIGHAPNSWFMRKAAQIGRGSYVHVARPGDVEERMNALWGRIQTPALTDIRVDWGAGAEYYPEIIPDLYAGEPLWLSARLPGQPTLVHLRGRLDGDEWNTTVNGWDALAADGGDNLAKLWARGKIEALEDAAMFGADPELTQLEITATALDYGLLTRHTSLVAVDKTPRRPAGEALAQAEVPNLLPAGSTAQVAAFPPTATGWLARAVLSLLVMLLATGMLVLSGSRLPMTRFAS